MAAPINLSSLTFNGDTLHSMSELSFEFLVNQRNALELVTTYGDIKVNTEVGFIGEGGLVGKASQGCDPTVQDFSAAARMVKWQPKDWEILLSVCYKDLDGTIAEYSRRNGINKPDLTDTDYYAVLTEVISRALNRFLWRFLWFNDTAAKNISDGGVITNGVAVGYFNIIDGYWKQIYAQVTANAAQHISISANSASTYATQVLASGDAKALLYKMTTAAPIALRQQRDKFILVSQNLYDAYVEDLSSTSIAALETVQSNFINGMDVVKCNGVEVIPMPEWDEHIQAYENTGAKYNLPFRAVFTCKAVLGAGFDKEGDFSAINAWYEKKDRKVYIEAMGNGDAKLLDPTLFVAAY